MLTNPSWLHKVSSRATLASWLLFLKSGDFALEKECGLQAGLFFFFFFSKLHTMQSPACYRNRTTWPSLILQTLFMNYTCLKWHLLALNSLPVKLQSNGDLHQSCPWSRRSISSAAVQTNLAIRGSESAP